MPSIRPLRKGHLGKCVSAGCSGYLVTSVQASMTPELSLNTAWHGGHCLCVIPNKIHVSQRQNCLLSFGWTQDFETKFGAQGEEMFVSIEMIETFL